jgi:hypothetical protein
MPIDETRLHRLSLARSLVSVGLGMNKWTASEQRRLFPYAQRRK